MSVKPVSMLLLALIFSACGHFNEKNAASIENLPDRYSLEVVSRLRQYGKDFIEAAYYSGEYETITSKIADGDATLIHYAPLLKEHTDAAAFLGLTYALSKALPKKTGLVLELMPHTFHVQQICTIPYIEPPIEIAVGHVSDSIFALEQYIEEQKYDPGRAAYDCLNQYQELRNKL